MRIRNAVLVAALVVAGASPALAQRNQLGISYDWSMPMGDMKDFADNDSWMGFTADYRMSNGRNMTFGGLLGYYEFYQNIPAGAAGSQVNFPQGAISGQQYRHVFSIPIMLSAQMFLGDALHKTRPFIGLNGGVEYLKQTADIGIYTMNTDAWVVAGMPEVGLMFTTSNRTQVNLHARYYFPLSSDALVSSGGTGASFQHLSVGIGIMGRVF